MKNKYHAKPVTRVIDGKTVRFDSKHEAERWDELRLLERAGKIEHLARQQSYDLIPTQRIDGEVMRKVTYRADFAYFQDGKLVVEDAKSPATRTREYIIKRKLMAMIYGIVVKEV